MLELNLNRPVQEREFNPEAQGRNAEFRVILIRHGEKDMNQRDVGHLTEQGRQQLRDFGLTELTDPERKLVVYSGDLARVVQSGQEALGTSQAETKVHTQVLDSLSLNIDSQDPKHPVKITDETLKSWGKDEMGVGVKKYLEFHDQSPDGGKSMSPRQVASDIAKTVFVFDRKLDRVKSGEKTDVLMVSSDYLIAAFAQEVMGVDFSNQPTIKLGESMYFTFSTDTNGKHTRVFEFRNQKYEIPDELLQKWLEEKEQTNHKE